MVLQRRIFTLGEGVAAVALGTATRPSPIAGPRDGVSDDSGAFGHHPGAAEGRGDSLAAIGPQLREIFRERQSGCGFADRGRGIPFGDEVVAVLEIRDMNRSGARELAVIGYDRQPTRAIERGPLESRLVQVEVQKAA
jgi:hypothetical protein